MTSIPLKLLRVHNFADVVAFFSQQFTAQHRRVADEQTLLTALDDFRYAMAEDIFSGPSSKYLRDWVDAGYLRHYYIEQDDIPRYELTPATEKLIDWLRDLRSRNFVGTESRLKTIFDLMRDLREQTEANAERRISLLMEQRAAIDAEIARIESGDIRMLTPTQVRERFIQIEDMARHLLRDFSEVEQNFRELDRTIRTRITKTEGGRGEVIAAVFCESDHIAESEQGRSFGAFFEFLISGERRDELDELLRYIYELPAVKSDTPDAFLMKIQAGLLDASGKTMETRNRLSAQLRRFLDDRLRHENTRILRLIQGLERELISVRDGDVFQEFPLTLDDLHVTVDTPVTGLFQIPVSLRKTTSIDAADARGVNADALFAVEQIDERRLTAQIRRCLESASSVSLEEVLQRFPVKQGLAELVTYVKLASKDGRARFHDDATFAVEIARPEQKRYVHVPCIFFYR